MWWEIETEEETVCIAHQLHLPYDSPCNEAHGHNYRVQVVVRAAALDRNAMVIDFKEIKAGIKKYDHSTLGEGFSSNDGTLFVPDKCHPHVEPSTAENFARVLFEELSALLSGHNSRASVCRVSVWETGKNKVTVGCSSQSSL